jgi:NAD(P)-dependent dehydrogenase (short-subunit alcohol dehydrogenase family)
MNTLAGKIVIVTGAKGGLGTYVTNAMLEAGATVIGTSRSIKQTDFASPNFIAAAAELGSLNAAQWLINKVTEEHGRVDALVHLVGGFDFGPPVDLVTDEAWEKMLDANFRSALHVFRAVIPQMRKQKSGRILAIGSRAAVEPSALTGPYNVSKAALVSLIRTIAKENENDGVSANIVLPGTMDTAVNRAAMPDADFSKWVQPSQVAALLVHLASDSASQITGAVIPVYAGT